ncbi:MAG: hypothetical protein ALMCE001_18510 [Methanocorpusculum sp. MCE]|nr:MAG: hypothetical protein ALMCE001_18510 [Methanocorpusculum sp. MCE]
MKTTKTIAAVLAVFLVAVLFMGAASAEPATGDVVYVYQFDGSGDSASLPYYRTDGLGTLLGTVNTNADGTFYGDGITEGVYYSVTGAQNFFTLKYPTITLSGYLVDSTGATTTSTSIAGRTLAKSETIRFITNTPPGVNYGLSFTTPAGGTTNVFGMAIVAPAIVKADLSFSSAIPATNGFVANAGAGVPLADVTSGEWSVKASLETGTTAGSQMDVTTPPQVSLN